MPRRKPPTIAKVHEATSLPIISYMGLWTRRANGVKLWKRIACVLMYCYCCTTAAVVSYTQYCTCRLYRHAKRATSASWYNNHTQVAVKIKPDNLAPKDKPGPSLLTLCLSTPPTSFFSATAEGRIDTAPIMVAAGSKQVQQQVNVAWNLDTQTAV